MTTLHLRDAPPEDRLRIYLDDHLSAATAGRGLAHRALLANRGTPFEPGLRRLAREIDGELTDLRAIIGHHGRRSALTPAVKVAAAIAAERLGRFKLNGQLQGYSPLSRMIELEGLAAGVQAKGSMWRSLRAVDDPGVVPDGIDLDRLIEQADDQLERLTVLHDDAATLAFRTT